MNASHHPSGSKSYKDAYGEWDELIIEAPLAIHIGDELELSNIRSPGDDHDLIAGFLLSEGFVPSTKHIESIKIIAAQGNGQENDMDRCDVRLSSTVPTVKFKRGHEIRPSCGLCGDSALPDDFGRLLSPQEDKRRWPLKNIIAFPDILRKQQQLFAKTGACHAAAIFDLTGKLLFFAEDVGRHNAVDKVIGKGAKASIDFSNCSLFLSGRCGYELISKALRLKIPVVASVSGTTSMSLDLAKKSGITLIGFCRQNNARVYNDPGRLI